MHCMKMVIESRSFRYHNKRDLSWDVDGSLILIFKVRSDKGEAGE